MTLLRFDHQNLRRSVWVTLVACLWAFSAGVVNACQLNSSGPTGSEHVAASHCASAAAGEMLAHTASTAHDAPAANNHQGADAGKDVCLKFCDDESAALVKVNAMQSDLAGQALVVGVAWTPISSMPGPISRRTFEQARSQGPPLVIRFLRLTLWPLRPGSRRERSRGRCVRVCPCRHCTLCCVRPLQAMLRPQPSLTQTGVHHDFHSHSRRPGRRHACYRLRGAGAPQRVAIGQGRRARKPPSGYSRIALHDSPAVAG